MKKKKILWIILLVLLIIAVILIVVFARPKTSEDVQNTSAFNKNINAIENNLEIQNKEEVQKQYYKTVLDDGILYSSDGNKVEPDIIIGDNYFDTTITDMYLNPQNYYNKKIQIEGMYLANLPYTFVGRYSTSNLCVYCPVGYSYLEYQLAGTIDEELVDEDSWIKVIGTLNKGNDETNNFEDYYYLDVITIEVMNEKGQLTVNN